MIYLPEPLTGFGVIEYVAPGKKIPLFDTVTIMSVPTRSSRGVSLLLLSAAFEATLI
jgi:hypothetical protein